MVAEVTIAAQEFSDVVTIERDWVVDRYGEPAVFVGADSLAALRRLALGTVVGDQVVVESGLEVGDLIDLLRARPADRRRSHRDQGRTS